MPVLSSPARDLSPLRPRPRPAADRPARPAPGLAVLLAPAAVLPLAGRLLRHGPALPLVPVLDPGHAERAVAHGLDAAVQAGFDVRAAEGLAPGEVGARLRGLDGAGCLAVATADVGAARRLVREADVPVLVLPPRGRPAGGPAVLAAQDAAALPAVSGALATDRAVIVMGAEAGPDTLEAVDGAWRQGLAPELVVATGADAVPGAAREREGVVVVLDRGTRRAPWLLREALRARRPTLLVPGPG